MVLSAFAMSTVGGTTFWIVYNIRLLLKIFFNTFWSRWPLCKLIPVCSRLEHYSSISDIQTLAMLCCTFGSKCSPHKTAPSPSISRSTSTESSQQHTNVSHYGENQIPVKILQKKNNPWIMKQWIVILILTIVKYSMDISWVPFDMWSMQLEKKSWGCISLYIKWVNHVLCWRSTYND